MNIVQIAGHLGADPETRFTASGQKVTSFRVANNVRKGGKDETIWWRVTVWGDRFDKMIAYLKKGSAIIAIGEMKKPEIYTDKEGRPQVSVEMTAEILQFSPFGKSTNQENSQFGSPGMQAPTSNQGTPFMGRNDRESTEQPYSFPSSNEFGAGSFGNTNQPYKQNAAADDEMPF